MIGYEIELEGLEPGLVMNNAASMSAEAKRVPKPEEECEAKCFRLPSKNSKPGNLYIPGEWLMGAVLKTASNIFKFKVAGKTQYAKTWLAGTAVIDPPKVSLGVKDYECYIVPAVVGTARILRARPRVFPWVVKFRLNFSDADPIYADVCRALEPIMLEMWRMTGVKAGVGDNRPSSPKKPGPHGRFVVRKCEMVSG